MTARGIHATATYTAPRIWETRDQAFEITLFCNNHALMRALGSVCLGEWFQPLAKLPPVMEIGYKTDATVAWISGMELANQTYFLSAGSVANAPKVQDAIKDRFDVGPVVFTIRFSVQLTLSDYSFGRWIDVPVTEIFGNGSDLIASRFGSCRNALKQTEKRFGEVPKLCPIDVSEIERRFCQLDFGKILPSFENYLRVETDRNTSARLALVTILHDDFASAGQTVLAEKRCGRLS